MNAKGLKKVTLDKERTLKFDFNSFVAMESVGVNLQDLGKEDSGRQMTAIRALLWAGLLHEDKDLTIDEVGAMITFDNMEYVMGIVGEAMNDLKSKK